MCCDSSSFAVRLNANSYILAAAFCALIASPFLLRRFARAASDDYGSFAVGGRNFGWFRIAAGLSATFVGGAAVINLAGLGYTYGWYALADVLPTSGALLLSAAFFVPRLFRRQGLSLGGFLQVSGTVVNAATGLLSSVVYTLITAAQIVALIRVAQPYFPLPTWALALTATLGVAAYVLYGGYSSVTVTDLIQFVVMATCYFGLVGLTLLVGGGETAPGLATPIAPQLMPLQTIVLLASPLLFVPVSQDLHLRVNSARNERDARIGVALAGCAYLLFGFVSLTLGRSVAAEGVPLASADDAVATFLQSQFGALAIIPTVAVMCVVVSTLDSVLFASASSLAYDFWDKAVRRERQRDSAHPRIATVVVLGAALVIAMQGPHILRLVLSAVVIYVAVLLPMFFGRLWRRRAAALGWLAFGALAVVAALEVLVATRLLPEPPFRAFIYTGAHLLAVLCLPREAPDEKTA